MHGRLVPEQVPAAGAGGSTANRWQMWQELRRGYKEMAPLNLALSEEGPVFEPTITDPATHRDHSSGCGKVDPV